MVRCLGSACGSIGGWAALMVKTQLWVRKPDVAYGRRREGKKKKFRHWVSVARYPALFFSLSVQNSVGGGVCHHTLGYIVESVHTSSYLMVFTCLCLCSLCGSGEIIIRGVHKISTTIFCLTSYSLGRHAHYVRQLQDADPQHHSGIQKCYIYIYTYTIFVRMQSPQTNNAYMHHDTHKLR